MIKELFRKTYFYTFTGMKTGVTVNGSGTITLWRWRTRHDAYSVALSAVNAGLIEQSLDPEEYKPYFTKLERLR